MIEQSDIFSQQSLGGPSVIALGPNEYEAPEILVPTPSEAAEVIHKPLIIEGAGQDSTIIRGLQGFRYNGMIGYARPGWTPRIAPIIFRDLTLDGNYDGQGGTVPYAPNGGILSLYRPYTTAWESQAWNGKFHLLERVRIYRAPGFGVQPANGVIFRDCLFERCGQPDLPVSGGPDHWDIVGGGPWAQARIANCTYLDSGGNYVDFVSANPNEPVQVGFIGNKSINHQSGGVYAIGWRSRVAMNDLTNLFAGSYVGYDTGTIDSLKSHNQVHDNILERIALPTHTRTDITPARGALARQWKDKWHDNDVIA